jgi:polyisoprenoid-binding protein YceI
MNNGRKLHPRIFVCAIAIVLSIDGVSHAAELQNYEVDPKDSSVSFSVKHIVVSEVRGRFKNFSGTIKFDEADLLHSSVDFKVDTPSIETDNERRDKDLRSPMFLDVAKYPEMSFASQWVKKSKGSYVLVGTLTLHGVTHEVRVPFIYNGKVKDNMGKVRIGFSATFTINRQDWGINYNKVLDNGGLVAGNEVTVQLDIVAVKQEHPIRPSIDPRETPDKSRD